MKQKESSGRLSSALDRKIKNRMGKEKSYSMAFTKPDNQYKPFGYKDTISYFKQSLLSRRWRSNSYVQRLIYNFYKKLEQESEAKERVSQLNRIRRTTFYGEIDYRNTKKCMLQRLLKREEKKYSIGAFSVSRPISKSMQLLFDHQRQWDDRSFSHKRKLLNNPTIPSAVVNPLPWKL